MESLADEIRRLVAEHVLNTEQADRLLQAAAADLAGQDGADEERSTRAGSQTGGAVLEVLGYVGGALVLGAIGMLAFWFWDDLDRAGRNLVAIAALVIPAAGGLILVKINVRRELGTVLLALACYAAGFCYLTLFSDDRLIATSVVVVLTGIAGVVTLRAWSLLFVAWSGGLALVFAYVLNGWAEQTEPRWDTPLALMIGFLLVCVLTALTGGWVSRTLSWALAGLSSWFAGFAVLFSDDVPPEACCLVIAALAVLGLMIGFVATRRYALVVVGCLILLTLWPAGLYLLVESALGVALGLIAAGAVLIVTVVALSRHSQTAAVADQQGN